MSPPRIAFDPRWLEYPTDATIVGTPGWMTAAHELVRTYSRGGVEGCSPVRGFGCGPPSRARRAAAGELLERFGASDPRVLLALEFDDPRGERTNSDALHPALSVDIPGGWVRAMGMITGRAVWIPAALAVLWYGHTTGRRVDVDVDATGLASGPSLAVAARHGMLEVIERDAVGLWWRCRRGHRLMKPPVEVSREARRAGLAVTAALIESDGIAPVVVVCISRADGRDATLGSACRADALKALRHATAEAFMIRATINAQLVNAQTIDAPCGVDRLIWGWWHGPEILERFHSPSADVSPTVGNSVEARSQIVFNVEPLCSPLSDIVLEGDLTHVARVLIPGAFRLEGSFDCIAHGGDRLSAHDGRAGGAHPFG